MWHSVKMSYFYHDKIDYFPVTACQKDFYATVICHRLDFMNLLMNNTTGVLAIYSYI